MATLYSLFLKTIQKNPHKIGIRQKENYKWVSYSFEQLYKRTNNCISHLQDYNVKQSDHIIYKGKNSVDWIAWNMATLYMGAVWIPIYHNQEDSYMNHIIQDSKAKLLIHDEEHINVKNSIIQKHHSNVQESNKEYSNYSLHNLSHLIYTSGTTGSPKGVMLTNDNLISNMMSVKRLFPNLTNQDLTTFNVLPWAHIYSLNTELYYNLFHQNEISICSHPNQFMTELREVQPHLLYLVPRVMEEIHKKLKFLDKNIINKIIPLLLKKIFGPNLITIFMGGAKLHPQDASFFSKNGISICEGYGSTEASPMISVNHLENPRDEMSIGYILDNMDVQIIEGEIYVSGPNISQGYWNDEAKTKESFIHIDDKIYYKTGDLGRKENNFLYYEGRASNNYKLSNGKFINVEACEKIIQEQIINKNFVLYGENREYNILITEKLIGDNDLEIINNELPKYAAIRKIMYVKEDTFMKFLTPKLSLKRKNLIESQLEMINDTYK